MNQELKDHMDVRLKSNQFINYIGLELVDIDKNSATMQLKINDYHMQHTGFTHGGVLATLCDVTTGIAAYTVVDNDKNVLTVDLKVSFVNPSTAPILKAIGQVKKAGQNLIFCEAEVWDIFANGDEKLVATCVSIMASVDKIRKQ